MRNETEEKFTKKIDFLDNKVDMSELINNSGDRKSKLKKLLLKLHSGESEDSVREELIGTLGQIPYGEVMEVEQELISEGLPESEVLKFTFSGIDLKE